MAKRRAIEIIPLLLMLLVSALTSGSAFASDPFLGEIRWVSFNFPPSGWAMCDGQTLQISQNQALFALLGTTYGGDGRTTFKLPDLRGRAPLHVSTAYRQGGYGGEERHTLVIDEIPQHSHAVNVDPREATSPDPTGKFLAKTSDGTPAYDTAVSILVLPGMLNAGGDGQSHENMKPYVTLNCIIAVSGIFPTRY